MGMLIIFAMLLSTVASAQVLGQGKWCFVPQGSEVLFCDYTSHSSCTDANAGGVCVPRPN